ncbi:hypothetical protein SBRCBS47491_008616 [Sporothrix bragantina]|uniref:Zn(2)-C6 fungal-type domain-containing protein n=1 Tax=Sporothrix bragantina TaxID=671064 RepID=A0ABP0CPG3_9PEZI
MDQLTGCFPAAGTARRTCHQCRSRKVRCDGQPRSCGNCRRLRFACSFAASHSTRSAASPSTTPQRQRVSRACNSCQQQKVRCSGTRPQCLHCARRSATCVYQPASRHGHRKTVLLSASDVSDSGDYDAGREGAHHDIETSAPPKRTTSTPTKNCIACQDLVLSLKSDDRSATHLLLRVDHFFQHAYPLPSYSFLHPATTRAKFAAGQLDPALTLAMCALTCLHPHLRGQHSLSSVPATSCTCQGTSLVREAETLIWQHLEYPTTARLQALLLSINHRMETGHFQRAFMLVSLAARSVNALGLHCERDGSVTQIHQEVRRRIVWSLKLTERYFSHGLSAFELCPYESIDLQLPCPEDVFQSFQSFQRGNDPAKSSGDGGAFNICVSLEVLRRDIMKMNRAVSKYDRGEDRENDTPQSLVGQIRSVEQRLLQLGTRFPQGTTVSHAEIHAFAQTPWIARHVQMHLSWHQCFCDMHRLLLPGFHEAAPFSVLQRIDTADLAWAEGQCVLHACAILDLLSCLNQVSTVPHLLEFDTAICSYQAALMVLFLARFGRTPQRPTREFATSRADLCLAALNRFFPASALVKPIREELQRAMQAFAAVGLAHSQTTTSATTMEGSPAISMTSETDTTSPIHIQPQQDQYQSPKARHIRDKLAIHSLLRRADFSDEDEGGEDNTGGGDTINTIETVPEDTGNTGGSVVPVVDNGFVVEQTGPPPQPPPFFTDSTDFLLSDGLLQQAPVQAPAFVFTEAYPLLENRSDGEFHMMDFSLFPWYGLMEQGRSDGGFS